MGRQREARWSAAIDVLRLVRIEPGITRRTIARHLGLSSGTATELIGRLRDRHLIAEAPAPIGGRGRPTTVIRAHPEGPLLVAIDIRPSGWTLVVANIDGSSVRTTAGPHDHDAAVIVEALRREVTATRTRWGDRLRLVSASVAGTVVDLRVVQAGVLGWSGVLGSSGALGSSGVLGSSGIDLSPIAGDLPLLVGNDATLAAVAEAGRGAARSAHTAVHLLVDAGIGGALTIDGQPMTGRSGAAGEYGHLPFGDPEMACACGAHGCWETGVDGRALARYLSEPMPGDPKAYTMEVLKRTDPAARTALARVGLALGRGTAGLVNAHDPDVVTLGGLAAPLMNAGRDAFDRGYRNGLMSFHRADPPPVLPAAFGADGGLQGAIDTGLELVTSVAMLDAWIDLH